MKRTSRQPSGLSELLHRQFNAVAGFVRISSMFLCLILFFLTLLGLGQVNLPKHHILTNWNQLRGRNMRRFNPDERFLTANNVKNLKVKWSFGTGFEESVAPVVVDGVVYVAFDYTLYALNAHTGSVLWQYTAGDAILGAPAVVKGTVYFGSFDSHLYAVRAKTGKKLWSFAANSFIGSSPTVEDGVVYVGSGYGGTLYAVDARTGKQLWSYTTQGEINSSAAVANGVVFAPSSDSNMYALDAKTGVLRWKQAVGVDFTTAPTLANGMVYLGCEDNVYALDARTGAIVWVKEWGAAGPAAAYGLVYLGSDKLYAVKAATGEVAWEFGVYGFPMRTTPAVANGIVYTAGVDYVYALDARTGAQLWKSSQTNEIAGTAITVVNGVVFAISSYPPTLYAFSLKHGRR